MLMQITFYSAYDVGEPVDFVDYAGSEDRYVVRA